MTPTKTPEVKVCIECPRCNGKGSRPEVWMPDGGVCYLCHGKKELTVNITRGERSLAVMREQYRSARAAQDTVLMDRIARRGGFRRALVEMAKAKLAAQAALEVHHGTAHAPRRCCRPFSPWPPCRHAPLHRSMDAGAPDGRGHRRQRPGPSAGQVHPEARLLGSPRSHPSQRQPQPLTPEYPMTPSLIEYHDAKSDLRRPGPEDVCDEEALAELEEALAALDAGDLSGVPPWSTPEETRAHLAAAILDMKELALSPSFR